MEQSFCEQVKGHRRRLKMTQSQIAGVIGYSVHSIQSWELGRTIPKKITRQAILQKLDITQIEG